MFAIFTSTYVFGPATGQRGFCLLQIPQTGSRAHIASYSVGTGVSFPKVNRAGRLVDYSPPFRVVVKNE